MKTLADLTAPGAVTRKLLEKDVQSQCVDWVRARGYWARKFSSMTQRSVPDYLFAKHHEYETDNNGLVYHTRIKFAVEFKAPGKTSTDAQLDEHKAMVLAGWIFFECDNFEKFKREVERIELTCCTTDR